MVEIFFLNFMNRLYLQKWSINCQSRKNDFDKECCFELLKSMPEKFKAFIKAWKGGNQVLILNVFLWIP